MFYHVSYIVVDTVVTNGNQTEYGPGLIQLGTLLAISTILSSQSYFLHSVSLWPFLL